MTENNYFIEGNGYTLNITTGSIPFCSLNGFCKILNLIKFMLNLLPDFTSQNGLIIAKCFDNRTVVFISGGTKQRVTRFIQATVHGKRC